MVGQGGRERGFSLVEGVITLAVLAIAMGLVAPAFQRAIARSRLVNRGQEIATYLGLARLEAMKKGRPVVVGIDFPDQRLVAFLDENDDLLPGGEEVVFNLSPVPGGLGEVRFRGPVGEPGTAADPGAAIVGLTPLGGGSLQRVAVFEPDGSIRDAGALRIADGREPQRNALEIRVAPRASARVELRKYVYGGPSGDGFYPAGGGLWEWY